MKPKRLLTRILVTFGLLFELNDALIYREPRIRRLIRAGPPLRAHQQNSRLDSTPTDSSDSGDVAFSDDGYIATMEPTTVTDGSDFFFANVVEDASNLMLETTTMDVPPPPMPGQVIKKDEEESALLTRRAWLQTGVFVAAGTVVGAATMINERAAQSKKPVAKFAPKVSPLAKSNIHPNTHATAVKPTPPGTNPAKFPEVPGVDAIKKLEPVNITQVAAETNVNVTLNCQEACISIDQKTMTKVQTKKTPKWVPSWLAPRPKVIKKISNEELLVAATIAGSIVDVGRTSLLYPVQTIKTRVQTDTFNATRASMPIQERMRTFGANVKRHIDEGNLYAGVRPTLLVSVPATGIYYGVRDVSKNILAMTPLNGIQIALLAALIGDIVSLCFRAPADTLRARLQNLDADVGDWFGDSLRNLPAIIITDLPYLLSKISLNRLLIHGSVSIDQYTEYAIIASSIAALLTTPFDVARTRILVDSDGDFANGIDGGSGDGVLKTMRAIVNEGNGGYANLFAGWFERVLYLGLGRAWLEPIQLIGYVGIRDAVLLEWF